MLPVGIARGKAALRHRQQRAIFAPDRNFKVAHVVVRLDFLAKSLALLGNRVQHAAHVEGHQLVAAAVTEHGDKGIVAVEQLALRRGYEHAFLRLLEQHAVLLFRHLARGRIVHHMDGALLLASLLRIR